MTKSQINEGNKLIAEFMGWTVNEKDFTITVPVGDLKQTLSLHYHEEWEKLMPVIEKIEGLGYQFKICRKRVEIRCDSVIESYPIYLQNHYKEKTKLLSAFSAASDFIKWQNELYNGEKRLSEQEETNRYDRFEI